MYVSAREISDRCDELYYYIEDEFDRDMWNGWFDDFMENCLNFANENTYSDVGFRDILSKLLPSELVEDDYVWDILLGEKTAEKVRMELYPEEEEEEEEEEEGEA